MASILPRSGQTAPDGGGFAASAVCPPYTPAMTDCFLLGRRLALVAVAAALVLIAPASVAAHAELESTTPDEGSTVEGTPPEIIAVFSEALLADGSGISLRDSAGDRVARGDVDPDDAERLIIDEIPELASGEYEVQWQARTDDGHIERDTWSFTVVAAPTPSPTAPPIPSEAVTPSASATASPSATVPSSAPPSAVANPSDQPGSDTSGASGGDVLLPIIVAVVIVAIGGAWLLTRRGRTGGTGDAGGAGGAG